MSARSALYGPDELARRVAGQHEGRLTIQSEEGRGAVVPLSVPPRLTLRNISQRPEEFPSLHPGPARVSRK